MSGSASTTSYDSLLKEIWPQKDIYDLLYENAPLYGRTPKKTNFVGKIMHLALGYGTTQGDGPDFGLAQASKSPSVETQFALTTATYYSLFSIDRKLIREARSNQGAIVEALDRQSTMAMKAWKRMNQILLPRNGGGALAQLNGAAISGATVTLKNLNDIMFFEKNMVVQFSTDDGTGGAGVENGTLKISKVDRAGGILTFTTNVTAGIATAGVNDYVFKAGCYNAVVQGYTAWIPGTAPSATTFFGVDRTSDTLRLGGIRKTVTGLSPREQMSTLAMEAFRNGASPSDYYLNGDDFLNLQLELQSAGTMLMTKDPGAKIGSYSFGTPYEGITSAGPAGPIKVFPDYTIPKGTGLMLQMNTWALYGLGDFPYFDEQDGNRILREASADSYEGRIVGDYQLGCEAPGYNVNGTL